MWKDVVYQKTVCATAAMWKDVVYQKTVCTTAALWKPQMGPSYNNYLCKNLKSQQRWHQYAPLPFIMQQNITICSKAISRKTEWNCWPVAMLKTDEATGRLREKHYWNFRYSYYSFLLSCSQSEFFYIFIGGAVGYCCTWSSQWYTQSVGLLWARDRTVAEISTWQHTTIPPGFESAVPASGAAVHLRLIPCGHRDRHGRSDG
jgi:hypothetical protein